MERFNYESESLKLIRDYHGMSQTAFAKSINITQSKLSRIENGELELPEENISNIKEFTKAFFNKSYDLPAQKLYYRKLSSTSKSMISMFEARLTLFSGVLKHLLDKISIPEHILPTIDAEDFNLDFEYIAEEIRIKLNTPRGAINDIVTLLEKNGIIIHFFDYDFITESNRKFDGVSTYIDGVPVILINNKIPNSRKVFTIAHELGHLVMHFDYIIHPDRDIEYEANKFASAFLAPYSDVKGEFKKFNLDKLFYLKSQWKMSAAAILYRAKEIGNINEDWYRKCMMWLSKYRKKEPYEFDLKTPSMLKRMIEVLKENTDFSFLYTIGINEDVQNELFNTIYPKKESKLKIFISKI